MLNRFQRATLFGVAAVTTSAVTVTDASTVVLRKMMSYAAEMANDTIIINGTDASFNVTDDVVPDDSKIQRAFIVYTTLILSIAVTALCYKNCRSSNTNRNNEVIPLLSKDQTDEIHFYNFADEASYDQAAKRIKGPAVIFIQSDSSFLFKARGNYFIVPTAACKNDKIHLNKEQKDWLEALKVTGNISQGQATSASTMIPSILSAIVNPALKRLLLGSAANTNNSTTTNSSNQQHAAKPT